MENRQDRLNFAEPTINDQVRFLANQVAPVASPWKDHALIADFSHWDGPDLDPKQMVSWVDMVILKAGEGVTPDDTFVANVQKFTDAGIPCGAYWFFRSDPYVGQQLGSWFKNGAKDMQFQAFAKALKYKKIYLTALDVEAYINLRNGNTFDDGWISKPAHWFMDLIEETLSPNLTYTRKGQLTNVLYSANWFIKSYAPSMEMWTPDHLGWSASYPYAAGRVTCTWEEFYDKWLPPANAKIPTLNCKQRPFWQFSGDKFILPGTHSPMDLNFFMGINGGGCTRADLYTWLGIPDNGAPPVDPPEEPQPEGKTCTVVADVLNLRSGPGTSWPVLSQLGRGQVLEVIGTEGEWVKVGLEGYVSRTYVSGL